MKIKLLQFIGCILYGGANIAAKRSVATSKAAKIININKTIKSRKVMKKKNYDEVSVVRTLGRNREVFVNTSNKTIEVLKDATNVGNGSWGKIDYLCHYCGYSVFITSRMSTHNKIFSSAKDNNDENSSVIDNKQQKRDRKFNMAAMTKAAMKQVRK